MGVRERKGVRAVKVNLSLVKCGRCGKRYSNPLTHVCVRRMDSRTRSRPSKVKPKLTVTCPWCGRPLGNPLTHACVTRTDFKQRKRKADRSPKTKLRPATTGNSHEPPACQDDDCPRYGCRMYKEGREDGKAEGYGGGYAQGAADGYSAGHEAGFAEGAESVSSSGE